MWPIRQNHRLDSFRSRSRGAASAAPIFTSTSLVLSTSGSTRHIPSRRYEQPVLVGHQMSGRVIPMVLGVPNLAVGDRAVVCPIIGCQQCRWCRSGSMAQCNKVAFLGSSWWGGALSERLNLYAYQCHHLPDSISDEVGALVEPFSATVHAVTAGHIEPDDSVAIVLRRANRFDGAAGRDSPRSKADCRGGSCRAP
jgi:Alcohol dehydrogenase GroES-like domain